ncbi:MAG: MFS transporter [Balneolaceae bacterium]|nr:MFS transporter [Balneolaceae bacterium]MBO6546469.1 MFS transporter [Balneolaceae bacterium]MBO6648828.1 MFS transporter [Balneolaceae bacterium]
MKKQTPSHILPVIVIAQFTGTSLWFAGNAVVEDLIIELGLLEMFVGFITMAVQAGFIVGTLVFAFLNIADRFSPVKVFLFCALAGSAFNLSTISASDFTQVMLARLLTGFFLAGIYPVGMKIASDWHKEGLGKALGYLVGALVLGTAFPHFLNFLARDISWTYVLIGTSVFAGLGGFLLFFTVKDGPNRTPSKGLVFEYDAIVKLFKVSNFRSAAFGYFGHMWELYTFWAFIPLMLTIYKSQNPESDFDSSFLSFLIIGIGGISCAVGGHISLTKGSKRVAMASLIGSGFSCLLLPLSFGVPALAFFFLLFLWGVFVIPDSPQFSTMVAKSCDSKYIATGLTIVNSLGFALTIVSIQLVNLIYSTTGSVFVFWIMLAGPVFGLYAISKYKVSP